MSRMYLLPTMIAMGGVRKFSVLSGACYESSKYDCDLKKKVLTTTPMLLIDKTAIILIGGAVTGMYLPFFMLKDLRGLEMDFRGISREEDFMCKKPVDTFGFLFA